MQWKGDAVMELAELIFLLLGTYFDIKEQELPVKFLLFFGCLAFLLRLCSPYYSLARGLLGGCAGCIFLVIGYLTKESIGYGDGIGLIILGIFEGWRGMIPLVIIAFLLSAIYGAWNVWGNGKSVKDEIPFYPFLLAAYIVVMFL
jgi:leader peptidase (prepilin peptidase)/N-methyltransferase